MTRDDFAAYVAAFNRNDYLGFGRWYHDDIIVELPGRTLRGREAVLDFYRAVKARIRETLAIGQVVLDADGIAAELDTEFHCLADAPDFVVRPMLAGETIRLVSFVLYRLRDGRIAHIRSARFRTPEAGHARSARPPLGASGDAR